MRNCDRSCIDRISAGPVPVNCACGVCEASASRMSRKQKISQCVLRERSLAVIRDAVTGNESNARTGSQHRYPAGNDYPPNVLPLEKNEIKVILSDGISSSENAQKMLETFKEFISKAASSSAIMADPDCLQKTAPACPDHESQDAFDRYFFAPMAVAVFPVMCDGVYTYCDAENQARLSCPNRMCCSLCNMVGDMHRCTDRERVKAFIAKGRQFMGDRETITRILSYVSDDRDLEERVIDAATWTTSTVEDSYRTIPVGILACRIVGPVR